jgi:hypothetical protein
LVVGSVDGAAPKPGNPGIEAFELSGTFIFFLEGLGGIL